MPDRDKEDRSIGAGGYHWKSKDHVAGWDDRKQALAPERDAAFEELLEQLPSDLTAALRVLDLGAGDGKVASVVLDRYRNASAILVDFSAPMMEKGVDLLSCFGERYRYAYWDMNCGDWPADLTGPFDAVVSSAAIHHLENERKRWLTKQVLARLVPGGVLANYDLFRDPLAQFAEDDIHGRTCATIDEATSFLTDVGCLEILVSARVARPKHKGELALVVGRKPRTSP